jgi:CheY-like chemotaxis protein
VADGLRLRQIVLNLAGNAVKFTDKGGITMRASWAATTGLRVEIEDTGIGIEPTATTQLFEMFTQADESDTRRHKGTGLGLSIVRRLVELMGGDVQVKSALGKGSTFWFEIPLAQVEGTKPDQGTAVPPPQLFDAHVLLVDDDRIAQFVVEELLSEQGCEVDAVADGREAVAAVLDGSYDFVLMDCQMPVMDGYEATARIRKLEPNGKRTPIVAMTASVMQGQSERCKAAGMDGFLGKPLVREHLQAALARYVKTREPE